MNHKLNDEISATKITSIIEFDELLFEYPVQSLTKFQLEIFSREEFIKTSEGLANMGNDFSEHWTDAWIKYSFLGFGKAFINDDSPVKELLPIDSKHWTSIEDLYAAIDKIKSTNMAEFDEEILLQTCILHLRIKFLKQIFPELFRNSSNFLKRSKNRINTLKSKSTVTNDTILRDSLEATIDKIAPQKNIGHSLNPLTIQSPTRNIISPNKTGLDVFKMIQALENQINVYGKIAFKEKAKKQRVYMSAIDLIQILKPHFMLNYEEFDNSPIYEDKTYTKTLYFKKYAKKKILEAGLFIQK